MRPPEGFAADLRAYDGLLRCRWGVHTGLWQIERRMRERSPAWLAEKPSPWKSKRGLDLWEGWKEGYVHVLSVHPDLLTWRLVVEELAQADFHRRGGLEAMNRMLDEAEEAWDRSTDRAETTNLYSPTHPKVLELWPLLVPHIVRMHELQPDETFVWPPDLDHP